MMLKVDKFLCFTIINHEGGGYYGKSRRKERDGC